MEGETLRDVLPQLAGQIESERLGGPRYEVWAPNFSRNENWNPNIWRKLKRDQEEDTWRKKKTPEPSPEPKTKRTQKGDGFQVPRGSSGGGDAIRHGRSLKRGLVAKRNRLEYPFMGLCIWTPRVFHTHRF